MKFQFDLKVVVLESPEVIIMVAPQLTPATNNKTQHMHQFLIVSYIFALFAWIPIQAAQSNIAATIDTRFLRHASWLSISLLIYECLMRFIWSSSVVAPIRIDILILIPAASLSSGYYALRVWRASSSIDSDFTMAGQRWLGIYLACIPLAAILGFAGESQRSDRMNAQFSDQRRIIYEMGFQSDETQQRFYGDIAADETTGAGFFSEHYATIGLCRTDHQ